MSRYRIDFITPSVGSLKRLFVLFIIPRCSRYDLIKVGRLVRLRYRIVSPNFLISTRGYILFFLLLLRSHLRFSGVHISGSFPVIGSLVVRILRSVCLLHLSFHLCTIRSSVFGCRVPVVYCVRIRAWTLIYYFVVNIRVLYYIGCFLSESLFFFSFFF